MKNSIVILFVFLARMVSAQSNADCINNIPLCSTPSFTFFAGQGIGNVDELPNTNNISNPPANPNPPNAGCLLTGENKPQWLLITVGNSGLLEFVFGAGNSPNPQVGYYDWAMWPYSPTACADIQNNILVPIRCNWNATSQGGTGIASGGNIPPGGNAGNYEAPLAVNACQQFIICISNYSGVNTLVSFQSLGTASLSCNPNCNPSFSICAGSNVTVTANNFSNLTNATYSMNPGGISNPSGTFVVTPLVTTSYTTYVTGTNQANVVVTTTGVTNVTVNPSPNVAPTFTQASCSNSVNAVNLNLGWNPAPSNYTVIWSPVPPSVVSPTQTSATGLAPGVTNVTVVAAGGCSTTVSFTMSPVPSVANFTITPPGATFSLTCTNTLIALNVAPTNYTYTWTSLSNTIAGTAANFTPGMQGTYTVVASNGIAGCSTTQTVTIAQNTVAPTLTVNPASQAITCNSGAPVTFTATILSATLNVTMDWYSPLSPPPAPPIASSGNSVSILSGALPPGVYTVIATNPNGCTSQKTVTITSLNAWPTFSVASPTNFSLGCIPINCTTISIINPVSTQTPVPATCSYTFLAPSFTGVVTPSIILGSTSSTVACTPGTWTVIVQDNSNFCRTILPISVLQNTVPPHVLATMLTQTLTCYNSTVLATGTSTTPNTIVSWLVPSVPPNLSQPTVVIGDPANGPFTSSTSLVYANFTVVANNTLNACQTKSVVAINQNFKLPISSPTISIATPTAIFCIVANAPVVLTTGNSTTTSGGGPTAYVANPCWSGPSPQTSTCGPSSYSCYVPGVYTLEVMDNYNGCKNTGTVNVLDRTQPPVITNSVTTAVLDCAAPQATLSLALTGTMTGTTRFWVQRYPVGAAFNPTNAVAYDINPTLAGTTSSLIMVDKAGEYVYVVTNALTGCKATGTVNVINGALTASFTPSPESGYAPLDVNFTNNSASTSSTSSTSSITSVWSFGNGTTNTSTNNANQFASYASPGAYTVTLITKKGTCVDTMIRVIRIDIPSKMEVPNIFTPNGDGSNDVFFLKAANLNEITCVIIDRWGNKVYETTSGTGNIAWDGKNFGGKECAAGVYFYIIKAKGKDDKTYEQKGNVTLIR